MTSTDDGLRIDRWLFFCRFFKTRTLAAEAVSGGHVKINGERVARGARVRAGDVIDLLRDRLAYKLQVTALPKRRGPATEAQKCYLEDAEGKRRREQMQASLRQDRMLMLRTKGKPDKHTRRKLRDRSRGE